MLLRNREFRNYSIQACQDKPCRQDIVEAIVNRIEHMTNRFSRVLFIRFDLRYPAGYSSREDNADMKKFINGFSTYLKREGLAYQYVWVREQSREKHQHYHVMFLLNGNKTRKSWNHLGRADRLWQKAIGVESPGLLQRCEGSRSGERHECHVLIERRSQSYENDLVRCVEWASYLAKTNTKGYAPLNVREWGASSLPCC
jgi:hypothetical protein